MPQVEFQFNKAQSAQLDRTLAGLQGDVVKGHVDKVFKRLSPQLASYVRRTQLRNQTLRRRSGDLSKAVEGRTERVDGNPAMSVGVFEGPALVYAGVQEEGTRGKNPESPYPTIRPVNGKALAMPVGKALNTMGLPICPGGPRAWPRPLHFVRFKGGRGAIGGLFDDTLAGVKTTKFAPHALSGMNDTLVYVLLAKADIPPHWYLRNGVKDFMPDVIRALEAMRVDEAPKG